MKRTVPLHVYQFVYSTQFFFNLAAVEATKICEQAKHEIREWQVGLWRGQVKGACLRIATLWDRHKQINEKRARPTERTTSGRVHLVPGRIRNMGKNGHPLSILRASKVN